MEFNADAMIFAVFNDGVRSPFSIKRKYRSDIPVFNDKSKKDIFLFCLYSFILFISFSFPSTIGTFYLCTNSTVPLVYCQPFFWYNFIGGVQWE